MAQQMLAWLIILYFIRPQFVLSNKTKLKLEGKPIRESLNLPKKPIFAHLSGLLVSS